MAKPLKKPRLRRLDPIAREDIARRAGTFFRTQGYDRATVRGLAEHLGVAASALYYHFPNKEALAVAWLDLEMQRLIERARAVHSAETTSNVERLRQFVEIHIQFQLEWLAVIERPRASVHGFYAVMSAVSKEKRGPLAMKQRAFLSILRDILVAGQRTGEFDIPDPTVTAFAILALGEHLVLWYRPGGRLSSTEISTHLVRLALRMARSDRAT